MKKRKTIDGGVLEGGGQILRITTCLSSLLQIPITIHSIRKNRKDSRGRPNMGLRNQHLTGICFLKQLSGANLDGGKVKSIQILFDPKKKPILDKKSYCVDAVTAGSIGLLIQVSFPILLFGKPKENDICKISFRGGTNVDFSPTIDYFEEVFLPIVRSKFGIDFVETKLHQRCVGPTKDNENGSFDLLISGNVDSCLPCFTLVDRGDIVKIKIVSFVTGRIDIGVAQNLVELCETEIRKTFKKEKAKKKKKKKQNEEESKEEPSEIEIESVYTKERCVWGNYCQIMLIAYSSTGCIFGVHSQKGKKTKPIQVIRNVIGKLSHNLKENGCVDEYLQDQLIILMALAKGTSTLRIGTPTLHTRTAMYFTEKMTGVDFSMEKQEDGSHIISVEGIGFSN